MMGERTVLPESVFYNFNTDRHVPIVNRHGNGALTQFADDHRSCRGMS